MENGKRTTENNFQNFKLVSAAFVSLRFCIPAFLIFAFVFAAAAQETPPAPSAPRAVALPKPVEKTLPNGLRVIVVERKNVPLVTAQLMIKSGGEVDPKNLSGLADMTAALLTKGTQTRTASQIAEEIEFLGGAISSGAGWDFSKVSINVMSDKLDRALGVMSDVVRNPAFKQEEIDLYRTQLLDNLSVQLKQPGTIASYAANNLIFGGDERINYGHPLAGTPESIARIKREDVSNLHRARYLPEDSVLVFAGDISSQNAFALANKWFGEWQVKRTAFADPIGEYIIKSTKNADDRKVREIVVIDLPNSGQAAVQFATPSLNRRSKDYFKASVLNSVFGGGYSARLNQEIRIKRGLSYGARSDFGTRRDAGIFTIRTQTKNESAAEVAELYVEELGRLAKGDLPETELVPRKSVLTGDYGRDLETTGGIAGVVAELAVYGLPLDAINSYIQNVQGVSADDVRGFAADSLSPSAGIIVIVGDAKKFTDDLRKRFPNTPIRTISSDKLDFESVSLEKK